MGKRLVIALWLFIATASAWSQMPACLCESGIASTQGDQPILEFFLSEGHRLTLCGNELDPRPGLPQLYTEFNIFNCASGEAMAEYDATQACEVYTQGALLNIILNKYLPTGPDWTYTFNRIGLQQIMVVEGRMSQTDLAPLYQPNPVSEERAKAFLVKLNKERRQTAGGEVEPIIHRLEVLALQGNEQAREILFDLENYLGLTADGAIAEEWNDAKLNVEWIMGKH